VTTDAVRIVVASPKRPGAGSADAVMVGLSAGWAFLLLHHVGAKSGAARTTPLLYHPVADGSGYVIIGSKGGSATNPAWLYNLRAHPDVEIEIPGEDGRRPVRAREVPEGEERERLWQLMVADWRFFDSYQRRTSRRIPVFFLQPR
jgi:deazaflavin-dependent oxidoreductase (nitroreductase family)